MHRRVRSASHPAVNQQVRMAISYHGVGAQSRIYLTYTTFGCHHILISDTASMYLYPLELLRGYITLATHQSKNQIQFLLHRGYYCYCHVVKL